METSDYNLFATVLTIIVVLISLVSIIVSIAQTSMTQAIANDSNKIAKTVMDTILFSHKINISPSLNAKFHLMAVTEEFKATILLVLFNEGRGRAIIEQVTTEPHISLYDGGEKIQYPIHLLFNNTKAFLVDVINSGVVQIEEKFAGKDIKVNKKEFYFKLYSDDIQKAYIDVIYSDELGTRYHTVLRYNDQEKKHVGVASELSNA